MRFDLLDEYSMLVPFGLGISRNRAVQEPAAPAEAAGDGPIANPGRRLDLLRKYLGAWCQMVWSSGRSLAARVAYRS